MLNLLGPDLTGWESAWLSTSLDAVSSVGMLALAAQTFPGLAKLWNGLVDRWRVFRKGSNLNAEADYHALLIARLQGLHFAGPEAKLEEIFIAPRLLAPQSELTEDELLHDGPATMHYLWPTLAGRLATVPPPSVTLSDLLMHGQRTVITGEPGAGKTTLLAYCAIQHARSERSSHNVARGDVLPIYVHLTELEACLASPQDSTAWSSDPLAPLLTVLGQSGLMINGLETVVRAVAASGRLFVAVDGWDELPGKGLGRSGSWLRDLLRAFPDTMVQMAGPPRGCGPLMRLGFVVLDLLPWRSGQATRLGQQWAEVQDKVDAPAAASYWRPGQAACETYLRLSQSLPPRPADHSQQEPLQSYIDGVQKAMRAEQESTPDMLALWQGMALQLLEDEAWSLSTATVTDLARDVWFDASANDLDKQIGQQLASMGNSPMFVLSDDGSIRFLSPVVRDYLAAQRLLRSRDLDGLVSHLDERHWVQVIAFCFSQADPPELGRFLASSDPSSVEVYQVAEWLSERHRKEPWYKDTLIKLGRVCLDVEQPLMARQRAAGALGAIGDPGVTALMRQVSRQYQPVMRQVALAVMARVSPRDAVDVARRLYADSDVNVRVAAVHAIGWLHSSNAEKALLEALRIPDEPVSQAAAVALALNGREEDYQALKEAANEQAFIVRRSGRIGLQVVDGPADGRLSAELAMDGDVEVMVERHDATSKDLADEEAKKWRPARAGDQAWLVSWSLEQGQVLPVGQAAVPGLIDALERGPRPVRVRAAATLGQLASVDGIAPLKRATEDEANDVRQLAYIALAKITRAWDIGS